MTVAILYSICNIVSVAICCTRHRLPDGASVQVNLWRRFAGSRSADEGNENRRCGVEKKETYDET